MAKNDPVIDMSTDLNLTVRGFKFKKVPCLVGDHKLLKTKDGKMTIVPITPKQLEKLEARRDPGLIWECKVCKDRAVLVAGLQHSRTPFSRKGREDSKKENKASAVRRGT
jgi:hypothetical protein